MLRLSSLFSPPLCSTFLHFPTPQFESISVFYSPTSSHLSSPNPLPPPSIIRYRSINTESNAFKSKLGPLVGPVLLLKALGFVKNEDEGKFVLDGLVLLLKLLTGSSTVHHSLKGICLIHCVCCCYLTHNTVFPPSSDLIAFYPSIRHITYYRILTYCIISLLTPLVSSHLIFTHLNSTQLNSPEPIASHLNSTYIISSHLI